MGKERRDGWFTRRIMRLTCFERRAMNSPKHARYTERTALALLAHVKLSSQPRCLEIGCGQGALARLLVGRLNASVMATDFDPGQVAVAKERLADLGKRVEFRVVDARELPFDDAQFDAVFSFGVLHHIPRGWRRAVAEVARVLQPNGSFIFTDFFVPSFVGRFIALLFPRLDQLEETALKASLADNGFHLEHYERGRDTLGLMRYCKAIARKG